MNNECKYVMEVDYHKITSKLLFNRLFTESKDITINNQPNTSVIHCYIRSDANPNTLFSFLGGVSFNYDTILKKSWSNLPKNYKKIIEIQVLFFDNETPDKLTVLVNSKVAILNPNYEIMSENKI